MSEPIALGLCLEMMIAQEGSDLHYLSGDPPRIRQNGDLIVLDENRLTTKLVEDELLQIMQPRTQNDFKREDSADFAYLKEGLARFRVNVFRHLNGVGAVFRAIPTQASGLETLSLPSILGNLCAQKKGMILVTGKTGSGKSTTLAAMVDTINQTRKGHILTIEDPIEFVHERNNCLISQREVGDHTRSFASALHSALREDPDVILVGELRDLETMSLAVTAAETGILVLGTLHTNSAAATVDRIINTFPVQKQPHIRTMLSTSLRGVVSQTLLKRIDNKGRVPAVEILVNNSAVANTIREGKTDQIESIMQGGSLSGMQTMDNSLRKLLDQRLISGDDAYEQSNNKSDFEKYKTR